MSTNTRVTRRPYSTSDKVILALQVAAVVILGTVALMSVSDPDWGDLQRVVILMMVAVWAAGVMAAAILARMVSNRWWRYALLVVGPFLGIVVLVVLANT